MSLGMRFPMRVVTSDGVKVFDDAAAFQAWIVACPHPEGSRLRRVVAWTPDAIGVSEPIRARACARCGMVVFAEGPGFRGWGHS